MGGNAPPVARAVTALLTMGPGGPKHQPPQPPRTMTPTERITALSITWRAGQTATRAARRRFLWNLSTATARNLSHLQAAERHTAELRANFKARLLEALSHSDRF